MDFKVLSALIGLAGAINNNGKTENTDSIVLKALLTDDALEAVEEIHKEKFKISPSCETCQFPCGNTSDYPADMYDSWTDQQKQLKGFILNELRRIAESCEKLPEIAYKAISYIGYDLPEKSYLKLLEELKQC